MYTALAVSCVARSRKQSVLSAKEKIFLVPEQQTLYALRKAQRQKYNINIKLNSGIV